MIPAKYDFSIVRGTAGPTQGLVVRLKAQDGVNLVDIPFDDVRLSIYHHKVLLLRLSITEGGLIVSENSESESESEGAEREISWIPTAAQTRLIPIGEKAKYELEVRTGAYEIVYLQGTVTGIGGLNDDEGDSESESE